MLFTLISYFFNGLVILFIGSILMYCLIDNIRLARKEGWKKVIRPSSFRPKNPLKSWSDRSYRVSVRTHLLFILIGLCTWVLLFFTTSSSYESPGILSRIIEQFRAAPVQAFFAWTMTSLFLGLGLWFTGVIMGGTIAYFWLGVNWIVRKINTIAEKFGDYMDS